MKTKCILAAAASMAAPHFPHPASPQSPSSNFGFAFNDVNFSDRIMRIEISPDFPGSEPDPDATLRAWARNRKRRRDDPLSNPNEQSEEQILDSNMPNLEDGFTYENQEEVPVIEDLPGDAEKTMIQSNETSTCILEGHEVAKDNEPSANRGVQVRALHISSPILAARSPFFYKLFSNGMKRSEQRHVTLRIQASEEQALLDLLNYMYSNTLPKTTPAALLNVLMAADKFEVLMSGTVQQLIDAAKQFLAARFKDLSKYPEEVLNLPLAGIEAVLSSDDLQVASEDTVYDFVVKWAQQHYPKLEERQDIMSKRLVRFVRFPCMSCRKLKKVLTCGDINPELASKVVLDAIFFKAEAPYRQRSLVAEDANSSIRRFVERSYKYRPVKVIEFESPRQQCIVYLDLKREECRQLFPSGRIYSQAFHLGGHGFFLSGHCNMDQATSYHCFGLFLGMQEKGTASFKVDYDFAARVKPSENFVSKHNGKYTFMGGKAVGFRNLFATPWTAFMADDSPYFINGVLHLKAELTIEK